MNEYLTELRRALPGGAKEREALLARFRTAMAPLEEEIGTPGYDDLVAAFGPPEEMAKTLTASPEGRAALAHVRRRRRRARGLSAAAVVCLLIIKHIPNIRRILKGTENRFGSRPSAQKKEE